MRARGQGLIEEKGVQDTTLIELNILADGQSSYDLAIIESDYRYSKRWPGATIRKGVNKKRKKRGSGAESRKEVVERSGGGPIF